MKFKLFSAFALIVLSTSLNAVETVRSTPTIDVFSVTALPGIGLTLDKIPSNIQTVKDKELKKQQSLSIADYMNDNLQGVSVNDTQNNPYQPDITFRGYSVSPILGGQTGMSVYVDGIRVNEPFGDGVNWDLIPVNAISGITLTPGSNPLYGLNTLGGALSVQTKSGRTHQGLGVEVSSGSWGRKTASAEFGGVSDDGSKDFFISANSFREDGWRNHSPSDVRQLFIKTGWQNEKTNIDLSFTGANNDMVGNGLIQKDLMGTFGRNVIHTRPDQTQNQLASLNLSGSHWINKDLMFSANTYHRYSKRATLNGDINDGVDGLDDAACRLADADSDEKCSGAVNRSHTKQKSTGFNAQLEFNQDFLGKKNQFIAGTFYDVSNIKYNASTVFGVINATRGVDTFGVKDPGAAVDLNGKTKTWSVFGTDTFSINDQWHLTMSGRLNRINVVNEDILVPNAANPASLSGDHTFDRLNPALGLNYVPTKNLTLYGSYNEGNRAPTSMELGCANPARPCKLPNAMAGDPPLKQVVAKTYELGLRGDILQNAKWSASAYRSENHDDIQFLSSNAVNNLGFFSNVGKTRRVGVDLALSGDADKLTWSLGYSYVKATYQSEFELLNEVNSTSFVSAAPAGGDVIKVSKGNRLANIPEHQFKARLQYALNQDWYVGTNITAFSDRYMRGNENNQHVSSGDSMGNGKIGGYMIVNLDTKYNVGKGLSVFAKAINVFDREYSNGGMMGESHFGNNGVYAEAQTNAGFVSPGAPRAGWIGVRYEFGGADKKD